MTSAWAVALKSSGDGGPERRFLVRFAKSIRVVGCSLGRGLLMGVGSSGFAESY